MKQGIFPGAKSSAEVEMMTASILAPGPDRIEHQLGWSLTQEVRRRATEMILNNIATDRKEAGGTELLLGRQDRAEVKVAFEVLFETCEIFVIKEIVLISFDTIHGQSVNSCELREVLPIIHYHTEAMFL